MTNKSQATDKVKQYITHLQIRYDKKPCIVRTDNGTEYVNRELIEWCKDRGIELQHSAPYSPQSNGAPERLNRTLIELARAMLIAKSLPECLWAEAVSHAAYLRNRATTRVLQGATPDGLWNECQPNVEHLREFGASVYVLREGINQSKLQPKSDKHTFVGFADGPRAIKYYDAKTRRVKMTRNYKFLHEPPVLQREGRSESKNAQATTETVDAQETEAEMPEQRERTSKETDSRKRAFPDGELEPEQRKSKRQTVRHDYQRLHDPEPEWAYLD
jgi:hypothetical protein